MSDLKLVFSPAIASVSLCFQLVHQLIGWLMITLHDISHVLTKTGCGQASQNTETQYPRILETTKLIVLIIWDIGTVLWLDHKCNMVANVKVCMLAYVSEKWSWFWWGLVHCSCLQCGLFVWLCYQDVWISVCTFHEQWRFHCFSSDIVYCHHVITV